MLVLESSFLNTRFASWPSRAFRTVSLINILLRRLLAASLSYTTIAWLSRTSRRIGLSVNKSLVAFPSDWVTESDSSTKFATTFAFVNMETRSLL